ncbi:MAG TPA: TetR family transcriptional regulator [Solirubrobacterales bacterium]|jgi:AcrR family transcriptional regulator|nr:TetR family transcriptional regulator [Solirubrobacterales bacterium]
MAAETKNAKGSRTSEDFQRARRPEQKEQRREAILAAAADLARRDGVREVTLSQIARAVGIHKSALLRYFETREQIFLELTGREWGAWREATVAALGALKPGDTDAVAAALAGSFVERRLLCDLIPHTALNLERHASVEAVHAYKLTSLGAVDAVAAALSGPLPDLTDDGRRELVSYVALLAGSMFQIATPPPPLADLYKREPKLGHSLLDLDARLTRATRVAITGIATLD